MLRPVALSDSATANLILWINRGLESLWLLTVALVPLAHFSGGTVLSSPSVFLLDTPKIALLRTLVGLIAVLWLAEWAVRAGIPPNVSESAGGRPRTSPTAMLARLWGRLNQRPARWVIVAVSFYAGAVALSAALSVSFSVSLWGETPGQDGSAAYTVFAYLMLFGVLATHLRTDPQIFRLLGAIAVVGVLLGGHGVMQHFGAGFLPADQSDEVRVSSVSGNPIFLAAILLMSISTSLALATLRRRTQREPAPETVRSPRFWMSVALWCAVLAIQALGMVFTLSRGPWVGAIVALAGFLVLVAVFLGRRPALRAALVTVVTAAVVAVVVVTTSRPESGAPVAGDVGRRFTSIGSDVLGGGLANRVQIWQSSWRLMAQRPWVPFDSLSMPFLRPLIGYGPDLFRSAYLLESLPLQPYMLPGEPLQAHNYLIHQGVELGYLGLISSLSVFGAVFLVGGYLLLWKRRSYSKTRRMVLIGVMAALGGRFVEQMVGVPRVGDLTIAWALLAVFVALPEEEQAREPAAQPANLSNQRRRERLPRSSAAHGPVAANPYSRYLLRLPIAVSLAVVIVALTWGKSVNYGRAALEGREANLAYSQGDLQGALESLDRAVRLAPDVFGYYHNRATVYSLLAQQGQPQVRSSAERECSHPDNDLPYEWCLSRLAYLDNLRAVQQRPYHYRTRSGLADASLSWTLLTDNASLYGETIGLYRQALEMLPNSWAAQNALASAYIQLGQPENAVPILEESLRVTGDSIYSAGALVLLGVAHRDLGDFGAALENLSDAIGHDPTADAYHNRGNVYQDLGQPERALEDLDEAIRLDSGYVEAYNSRGFAHFSLEQPSAAVKDFSKAIELDPEFVLAFVNRTKAATLLGDDVAARQDLEQAVALGYDRALLEKDIKDIQELRARP